jgi:hypothetical protein
VRIVAVSTAHLALAQRMMIWHAQLRALGPVATKACLV